MSTHIYNQSHLRICWPSPHFSLVMRNFDHFLEMFVQDRILLFSWYVFQRLLHRFLLSLKKKRNSSSLHLPKASYWQYHTPAKHNEKFTIIRIQILFFTQYIEYYQNLRNNWSWYLSKTCNFVFDFDNIFVKRIWLFWTIQILVNSNFKFLKWFYHY